MQTSFFVARESGGPQRSGVDPPLSSSRACLMAFIAFSVPFVFMSLRQFHPVLLPHLPELGKGWLSSIGFGAFLRGGGGGFSGLATVREGSFPSPK